jgi:hypothetical protein
MELTSGGGRGGETKRIGEETAFNTRKLVDNFRGSADPHQVHGGIGGGLLDTLQECPDKLEGGQVGTRLAGAQSSDFDFFGRV